MKSLPYGNHYYKNVRNAMAKQSSYKNIRFWLTTEQRQALDHDKVLFWCPWGTGKTTVSVTKAYELAQKGQSVLFLIFYSNQKSSRTLLSLLRHKRNVKSNKRPSRNVFNRR